MSRGPHGDAGEVFFALQRLLLVAKPSFGETRWQGQHGFGSLSAEQREPGHWYRSPNGFIYIDERLNGQFVKELPPEVDPVSVIDVPYEGARRVLDVMAALITAMPAELQPRFLMILENLKRTSAEDHELELTRQFQVDLFARLTRPAEEVLAFLHQRREFYQLQGVFEGFACSLDVSGAVLIEALAREVLAAPGNGRRIVNMLAAPGAPTMDWLAGGMVWDCFAHGLGDAALRALARLSEEGNEMVDAAREGVFPVEQPEMLLPMYYFSMLGAAPYFRAVMVGYETAATVPALPEETRRLYATRANAAEEKLVRISDAISFSVRDLERDEKQVYRAEVQKLLAEGEEDKADDLVMTVIDLSMYLPRSFREYLTQKSGGEADSTDSLQP